MREATGHKDGIPDTWSDQDIQDVHYRSQLDPVDPDLVEPLGWVAYAAIRFHSTLRSVWTFQLGGSDKKADAWPTGTLANNVVKAARDQGDPRADAFEEWYRTYGCSYGCQAALARSAVVGALVAGSRACRSLIRAW